MKPSVRQFYQHYFQTTQSASWLFRLVNDSRLSMLETLMQWELTDPLSDSH